MKLRKFLLSTIFIFTTIVAIIYFSILFVLPVVFTSNQAKDYLIGKLRSSNDIHTYLYGQKLKVYPNLSAEIKIPELYILNKDKKEVFALQNIQVFFKPFKFIPREVIVDYMFLDRPELAKVKFQPRPKKNKSEFSIETLPFINIRKSDIVLQDNNVDKIRLLIGRLNIIPNKDKFAFDFFAKFTSTKSKKPIKLRSKGTLSVKNNTLIAESFNLKSEIASLQMSGKIIDKSRDFDLKILAKNLSVKTLKIAFLATMKNFKPNEKNFIENFHDFNGLADLDLKANKQGLTGTIHTKNLSAKTVKFDIPILFPDAKLYFTGDGMHAEAEGLFGTEKVFTDIVAVNMFDPKRTVTGHVKADVGSRFAKTYVPDTDIKNSIKLSLKYVIHNQKPLVEYWGIIPIGSNIYYRDCDLGLLGDKRRVYARTLKDGDSMILQTYDYSVVKPKAIENIITGDGLFKRKDSGSKFRLEYLTGRTNGDAPVSLTGSFGKHIQGGTFNGNLKYDYPKGIITGQFKLKDSAYKDFYVQSASVTANDKIMEIRTTGTYNKAKYAGYINLDNSFEDRITIHDLKLYLEKFALTKNKSGGEIKIPEETKNIDWIIEHGSIKLDKITYERVVMERLYLVGSLRNLLVNFDMPDIKFANGLVSAKGTYDISTHSSDIDFKAENIDSKKAADMLLNLQDQVMGYANVKTHVITKNKLAHVYADTTFHINEGALTQLGNRELVFKDSKNRATKYKLPDIIRLKKKKIDTLKADLRGTFKVSDENINDINVYSYNKKLAMFLEGNYNMDTQHADLMLWGKYNKSAQRGIKIFFVPLSIVTKIILRPEKIQESYIPKINQIPNIEAAKSELEIFKVKAVGNPNAKSKVKFELNRLYQ